MKKKRSFFKRHFFAIIILVIVATYSGVSTLNKELTRQELLIKKASYLAQIEQLRDELAEMERDLARVETPEYIEEYAREVMKMIGPDEFFFQIHYQEKE